MWGVMYGQLSTSPNNFFRPTISPMEEYYNKHSAAISYFVAWLTWLLVGTLYYSNVNFGGNYAHGFYYSVNVGYSVGWSGLTDYNTASKWFSVFYLLVGALFLTRWLVFLVENAVDDSRQYEIERRRVEEQLRRVTWLFGTPRQICVYLVSNHQKLLIVYFWFIYVFLGAFWSCYVIEWPFLDGLYFALSSLSTGGMWSVPLYSKDFVYGCVGIYTCLGVPIMGMAMGNIATLMFESRQASTLSTSAYQPHLPTNNPIAEVVDQNQDENVNIEANYDTLARDHDHSDVLLSPLNPRRSNVHPSFAADHNHDKKKASTFSYVTNLSESNSSTNASDRELSFEYVISALQKQGKLSTDELESLTKEFHETKTPKMTRLRINLPAHPKTATRIAPKNADVDLPHVYSSHHFAVAQPAATQTQVPLFYSLSHGPSHHQSLEMPQLVLLQPLQQMQLAQVVTVSSQDPN